MRTRSEAGMASGKRWRHAGDAEITKGKKGCRTGTVHKGASRPVIPQFDDEDLD